MHTEKFSQPMHLLESIGWKIDPFDAKDSVTIDIVFLPISHRRSCFYMERGNYLT
ncbi:hypothetical protein TCARB_1575 [Thermofilum adornatum 1505]|uniref:Uncharacterized protein n=1 Tax=Thermofilum adornatum 1505 TaxID=697581 RepID=A0A3G1A9U0_9CREN|nr:hypothetical protein TCARB_1575 [Thermofilum adornatum 1505]